MRPVLTNEEVADFRADVCRAAEVLFARQGVAGVTMRQIAAELGCSPTTAYHYFRNKDEILAAVRASAFNRFCEVIEEATRSSRDPRTSAWVVGQAYLGFALANPDAYRMMFDVSQADVTASVELTEALARARRTLVAYIEPMIDKGSSRDQAQALGHMLWASTHGLVMLRLSGIVADDNELRQLHEKTMSTLMRGARQTTTGSRSASARKLIDPAPSRRPRSKTP